MSVLYFGWARKSTETAERGLEGRCFPGKQKMSQKKGAQALAVEDARPRESSEGGVYSAIFLYDANLFLASSAARAKSSLAISGNC